MASFQDTFFYAVLSVKTLLLFSGFVKTQRSLLKTLRNAVICSLCINLDIRTGKTPAVNFRLGLASITFTHGQVANYNSAYHCGRALP